MCRPWVQPELPPLGPEDEDVTNERERVLNGTAKSDILSMINLSKVENQSAIKDGLSI